MKRGLRWKTKPALFSAACGRDLSWETHYNRGGFARLSRGSVCQEYLPHAELLLGLYLPDSVAVVARKLVSRDICFACEANAPSEAYQALDIVFVLVHFLVPFALSWTRVKNVVCIKYIIFFFL